MKQKIFVFNVFGENTKVFSDAVGRCVVADPGCGDAGERGRLMEYLKAENLTPEALDVGFTPTFVKDGDVVSAAGFDFEVIETPGHSPGGVCYLEKEKGFILTGETYVPRWRLCHLSGPRPLEHDSPRTV